MNALAKRAVSERELLLTRVSDAPVELVWQAWTQKPHLEKWLAPHTVTIVHAQVDLRVGGRWRLRVRFPGGAEYWVGGVYREIVPNKLLVMTDTWDEESATPGPETIVTVRFKDVGGKFRFRLKAGNGQIIASSEAYESKAAAQNGIKSVRTNAPTGRIDDQT